MKTKCEYFHNGAFAQCEKQFPSGMYLVQWRNPSGDIGDRVRCDDYCTAMQYWRAFRAAAKNS